jgi:peptide-methionine (S)-S-oxide reductase
MGLFDFLGGAGGAVGRDYADVKPGSLQAEAAEYAKAREVKTTTKDGYALAMFGGGCFWGIELAYARVPGVISTCVGYAQGKIEDPSYEFVCTGATGHTEVVQMAYDPKQVSYKELCAVLFSRINPSLKDQVGNDRGTQYRHGAYYYTEAQKKEAEEAFADKKKEMGDGAAFFTELLPAEVMYPAEEYHQQYLWEKGGRGGSAQSAAKGCTDTIRCYG